MNSKHGKTVKSAIKTVKSSSISVWEDYENTYSQLPSLMISNAKETMSNFRRVSRKTGEHVVAKPEQEKVSLLFSANANL